MVVYTVLKAALVFTVKGLCTNHAKSMYYQTFIFYCYHRKVNETCDFGRLRQSIIFPSEIKVVTKRSNEDEINEKKARFFRQNNVEIQFQLSDPQKCPIIAIVNKKSGGQIGQDILNSFYRYLNPIQVM